MDTDALKRLLALLGQLEESCLTSARCAAKMRSALQKEMSVPKCGGISCRRLSQFHGCPKPTADAATMCIRWCGKTCPLGHTTLFRLFGRLLRHPNTYVSY